MADLGKLLIRYGVDMREVEGAHRRITSLVSDLGSKVAKAATVVGGAVGFAGMGFAAVQATRQFVSFDEAITRIGVVCGATSEEFERLRSVAREMATQTEYSATQVAEGMYFLASAGLKAADQLKVLPSVLDLATAGNIEMSDATDLVVRTLGAFRLEADQAGRVADVLASAVNNSQLQFRDLVYSMRYVAPVASAAGQSLEEVTAALAIMSLAGIKGEQAGTAMRGAFVRLIDPTKETKEAMTMLGLTADQLNPSMHTLTEIIRTVANASQQLDDATRNQALSMLFGTEALSGMLAIINQGPDALARMTEQFKSAGGAARDAAAKTRESLGKQLQMLRNQVMEVAYTLIERLVPAFKRGLEAIKEWIARGELQKWADRAMGAMERLAGILGRFIGVIRNVVSGLGGLKNALLLIGGVWAGLRIGSWVSSLQAFGGTLTGVFQSAVIVMRNASTISLGTSATFGLLGAGIAMAIPAIQGVAEALRTQGSAAEKAAVAFSKIPIVSMVGDWTGYKNAVEEARKAEEQLIEIHRRLEELESGRKAAVRELANAHRAEAAAIVESQKHVIEMLRIGGVEADLARDIVVAGAYDQKVAWEGLLTELQFAQRQMSDAMQAGREAEAEHWRLKSEYIKRAMVEWAVFSGYLTTKVAEAAQSLRPLPEYVTLAFQANVPEIQAKAREAITTYISTLVASKPELQAQAQSVSAALADALAQQTPEAAAKAGELLRGLLNKLVESKAMLPEEAKAIAQSFTRGLDLEPAKQAALQALGDLASGIERQGDQAEGAAEQTGQAVEEGLSVSDQPVVRLDHVLQQLDETLSWWKTPIVNKAKEIGSGVHRGLTTGSGALERIVPASYARMFAAIEAELGRGTRRLAAYAPVFSVSVSEPRRARPLTLAVNVGTLVADDRSLEEFGRRLETRAMPRLRRMLG